MWMYKIYDQKHPSFQSRPASETESSLSQTDFFLFVYKVQNINIDLIYMN